MSTCSACILLARFIVGPAIIVNLFFTQMSSLVQFVHLNGHLKFNLTKFVKHIKLFHSLQPGFSITCGLHECLQTFNNFRTF